ncbi:immunoglobulin superfamily member 5-like isoform X3 [Chiloscyllium plagiosum]|uniref:immunoglobulin superfamily member 5-like isoform X3 n=1 Tax=Chiloscyllium plagiosum TaxID=36176 RepID=UPI001CB88563|nr:immunoglobulin superfamily member 5-like isoform X3 [Chiloscyllium plagiosum]
MGTVGTIITLLSILLGACLPIRIIDGPKDAFVLLNSDAAFNCTVSLSWTVIIWLMNSTPVLTVIPDRPIITDSQFGQRNYTTPEAFTSELIISRVSLKNNATVECSLQTDGSQQANLFVQVEGKLFFESKISSVVTDRSTDIICKAEDWNPDPTITWTINRTTVHSERYTTIVHPPSGHLYTAISTLNLTLSADAEVMCHAAMKALPQPKTVALNITVKPLLDSTASHDRTWLIVAIVVPIAVVLLLIILIIVIACCIKRTKHSESSYQDEIRKISKRKPLEMTMGDQKSSGLENFGMSSESVDDFNIPSAVPATSQTNSQTGNANIHTIKRQTVYDSERARPIPADPQHDQKEEIAWSEHPGNCKKETTCSTRKQLPDPEIQDTAWIKYLLQQHI